MERRSRSRRRVPAEWFGRSCCCHSWCSWSGLFLAEVGEGRFEGIDDNVSRDVLCEGFAPLVHAAAVNEPRVRSCGPSPCPVGVSLEAVGRGALIHIEGLGREANGSVYIADCQVGGQLTVFGSRRAGLRHGGRTAGWQTNNRRLGSSNAFERCRKRYRVGAKTSRRKRAAQAKGRRSVKRLLVVLARLVAVMAMLAGLSVAGASPAAAVDHPATSCQGTNACTGVPPGNVGENSCNGNFACNQLVGTVGTNSCNGNGACNFASGGVGNDSCNGGGACEGAGAVGDNSCNGSGPCTFGSGVKGDNSCNGDAVCVFSGTVGDNSCNREDAGCFSVDDVGDCEMNTVPVPACDSPDAQIVALGSTIEGFVGSGGLTAGQAGDLQPKLTAAREKLAHDPPKRVQAIKKLEQFIAKPVRWLATGRVDEVVGTELIDSAQAIIAAINATP